MLSEHESILHARITDLEAEVEERRKDRNYWCVQSADFEARAEEAEAEVERIKEYAEEGWSWLGEALDALGAKTVFDIAQSQAEVERLREFLAAYDAWQVGKVQADADGDWLRIAPLYDAMLEARAALASLEGEGR